MIIGKPHVCFVESLANGVALIVVPAAGKGEQLRLQVSKPGGLRGQIHLSRLELRRRHRHPADLVADRLDPEDAGDLRPEFLHQRHARASVFDEDATRVRILGQEKDLGLQRRVIRLSAPRSVKNQRLSRVTIHVVQTDQSLSGPPLLAVSQLCSVMNRSFAGGSSV